MYEKSVGRNATLIVGLTPNPDGLLPQQDVKRLQEWGEEIQHRFGKPLAQTSGNKNILTLKTGKKQTVNYYMIQEDITQGERIRSYRIEARQKGQWSVVAQGTSVGHKRIGSFPAVEADAFRLVIEKSQNTPYIINFSIYNVQP